MYSSTLYSKEKDPKKNKMYLVLYHVKPCLSTQDVTDGKLHNVEWEIEDNAVNPDDTSPSPTDSMYSCKTPVGIYCYESSNLKRSRQSLALYDMYRLFCV